MATRSSSQLPQATLKLISPTEQEIIPSEGTMAPDTPASLIGLNDSPRIVNFRFEKGAMKSRYGLSRVGTAAIDSTPYGVALARWRDGTSTAIALSRTKAYYLNGSNVWTELTAGAGAGLNGGTDIPFSFAVWSESDRICFSQGADKVQYFQKGGSTYELLSSDAPASKILRTFNRRLNLFCTYESTDWKMVRHRYCVSGNITDWTGIGSGYRDLSDREEEVMTAASLSGAMFVYKSKSITRITGTGSALTPFQYDQSWSVGRGIIARRSLVSRGTSHYGLFNDGVFSYTGSQFVPIGRNKVDESILRMLSPSAADGVVAHFNVDTSEYMLGIPTGASWYPNTMYIYNEALDRWSTFTFGTGMFALSEYVVSVSSPQINSISETIDSQIWSMDYLPGMAAYGPMMFGLSGGDIAQLDTNAKIDIGDVTIPLEWQSRDFKSDIPSKATSLSGLGIEYEDVGAATLIVDFSVNGGLTWTGGRSITIGGAGDNSLRLAWCWFEHTDSRIRFRVINNNPSEPVRIVRLLPIVADGGDIL